MGQGVAPPCRLLPAVPRHAAPPPGSLSPSRNSSAPPPHSSPSRGSSSQLPVAVAQLLSGAPSPLRLQPSPSPSRLQPSPSEGRPGGRRRRGGRVAAGRGMQGEGREGEAGWPGRLASPYRINNHGSVAMDHSMLLLILQGELCCKWHTENNKVKRNCH